MTEFEIATLAAQEATRETTLWVGVALVAATLATALIGLGQIAVVWYGIRAMQKAGDLRAREQDQRHEETMTTLREATTARRERHEETMTALRELIERTAPPATGAGDD